MRRPRVAGAGLFSDDLLTFRGELAEAGSLTQGEPPPDAVLARFVREGRMVPAQVPFAKALLAHEGAAEFSGDRRPLRELLLAMLERQPPLALFGQTAPARNAPDRPATMLPEEAAFYQRHFPGVPLTMIAEAKGG